MISLKLLVCVFLVGACVFFFVDEEFLNEISSVFDTSVSGTGNVYSRPA